MKNKRLILLFMSVGLASQITAQRVFIQQVNPTQQSKYAVEQLTKTLIARHYTVRTEAKKADYTIRLAPDNQQLGSEAYSINRQGNELIITGGDARGLIYGSLSLVEELQNGASLQAVNSRTEKPHLRS